MRLYRAKIAPIANDCVAKLIQDGDIEVEPDHRDAVKDDFIAIMEDYLRRDLELRDLIRDQMAAHGTSFEEYGRTRGEQAERRSHPTGDDVERYLVRQFIESMLISPSVDEVYAEDAVLHRKLMEILLSHDVDEQALRLEAKARIKNLAEGSVGYEIAMSEAIKAVKKSHGLL